METEREARFRKKETNTCTSCKKRTDSIADRSRLSIASSVTSECRARIPPIALTVILGR